MEYTTLSSTAERYQYQGSRGSQHEQITTQVKQGGSEEVSLTSAMGQFLNLEKGI